LKKIGTGRMFERNAAQLTDKRLPTPYGYGVVELPRVRPIRLRPCMIWPPSPARRNTAATTQPFCPNPDHQPEPFPPNDRNAATDPRTATTLSEQVRL